jgi:N-acetylated-alpha-linked acidic dipeptidase
MYIFFRREDANMADHSNYDSFYWMDTFGDPGWFHHQQIAQMWGLTALRLASYPIIPFTASAYTHKLRKYVDSLGEEALSMVDGDMNQVKKRINLDPLERAIAQLSKYARKLDEKADDLEKSPYHRVCYFGGMICLSRPRKVEIDRVNEAYFQFERIFIGKGLPGRPFYKHVVYAPGIWEGYAGLTFPSIREAITGKRWQEARDQIKEITHLLNKVTSKAAL